MLAALFQAALVKFGSLAMTFISVNLLSMVLDAIDEAAETVLDLLETKAKKTPEKADDRRIAILRKWFGTWKDQKK